jgi:VWFA-related protein
VSEIQSAHHVIMMKTHRLAAFAAGLGACLVVIGIAAGTRPLQARAGQGAPTFRSTVDVIPVDVQVVDNEGQPISGLTAAQFDVTIGGRRRRVVSADLVDFRRAPGELPGDEAARPAVSTTLSQPPRVMILVVDSSTLDLATAKPILTAAQEFVRRLPPEIELGLFTIPVGPQLGASLNHLAVIHAIDAIVPQHDTPPIGEFSLSPADVVELSTWTGARTSALAQGMVDKLCASADDPSCPQRLASEVQGRIIYYEGMAGAEIGTLRSLMTQVAAFPYRKTLVLISGGVVSADMPGGRPDIRELGIDVGKLAAAADVNVYTLFVDQALLRQQSAEVRLARNSQVNVARESDLLGRWLDQFSGVAGGSMQRVAFGDGSPAFNRVISETSAYYLLGVEPAADDRDGRPHELKVKVQDKRANIRGRSWVVVPKSGTVAPAARASTASSQPVVAPAAAPPRVAAALAPGVRALADAFDRDDRAAIMTRLTAKDGDDLIRAFREGESPWPDAPRRTAAFALDVALAGLRADSTFTKDAAVRLLAEYLVRVRAPQVNDAFECAWLRTGAAAVEGVFAPQVGLVFADRAVERCPNNARLRLAVGVIRDQQYRLATEALAPPRRVASTPGAVPTADEGVRRVLDAYAAVEGDAASKFEARVRAAWLCLRTGQVTEGLELINAASGPIDDRQVLYLRDLVRGMLLRAAGQADAAAGAFRAALVTWPKAQAARVALMALLVSRGETDEAAALSEGVMTAGPEDGDPWWLYWLGDYRAYPELRARLREAAR